MDKKENNINEQTKEYLDSIKFISEEEIENLDFYETCLYLEKLNVLDNATKGSGDNDE